MCDIYRRRSWWLGFSCIRCTHAHSTYVAAIRKALSRLQTHTLARITHAAGSALSLSLSLSSPRNIVRAGCAPTTLTIKPCRSFNYTVCYKVVVSIYVAISLELHWNNNKTLTHTQWTNTLTSRCVFSNYSMLYAFEAIAAIYALVDLFITFLRTSRRLITIFLMHI